MWTRQHRQREEGAPEISYVRWNYHGLDETFDKVIFLDVDGVLNDEGERRDEQHVYIEDSAMDALARIVSETGAEIVLSSSWRYTWAKAVENDFEGAEEPVLVLRDKLAERGLKIAGYTPLSTTGPSTRPLEIRTWLLDKELVTSFVILDDDTFWEWCWMTPHVVVTQTKTGKPDRWGRDMARGLTEAHADEAIRILRGNDEISVDDTREIARQREDERRQKLADAFCEEHPEASERAAAAYEANRASGRSYSALEESLAADGLELGEFTAYMLANSCARKKRLEREATEAAAVAQGAEA